MTAIWSIILSTAVLAALLALVGREKRGQGRAELHPADLLVLAALAALAYRAPFAWAPAAVSALTFALFLGLSLDAVLYRLHSVELGLTGVRAIVLPVLYRELTELASARRFWSERWAFAAVPPLAAVTALLPLAPEGTHAGALGSLASAAVALGAFVLGDRGLGVGVPSHSAIGAFLWGRDLDRREAPLPRPGHAALLRLTPRPPQRSARHGAVLGADVVLWSLESVARDALRPFGGPAHVPFLESLIAQGGSTPHHFAPSPLTSAAHRALYTSSYPGAGSSALPLLTAAGYRTCYLTPYRTAHYGLWGELRAAGFEHVIDRQKLRSGRDSELAGAGLGEVLRALGGARGFLHVHTANTHLPYLLEEPAFARRFGLGEDQDRYLAAIEEADRVLERFVTGWTSARGAPLLVVISDHGQSFGQKGYRSHGSAVTREQVNVPFVVHHPALGRSAWRWSSHFDVLPTILDLVGLDDPRAHVGEPALVEDRPPALLLWAGQATRSSPTQLGAIVGHEKLAWDAVLERCEAMDWEDVPRPLAAQEREAVAALLSRACAKVGVR